MVKAAYWLLCTYAALKLIQIVFGGRPGSGDVKPGLRDTLLRGEPILFAAAFAISVPAALGSSWLLHRGYARAFAHSTDCYGRLRALDALGDVGKSVDAFRAYDVIIGSQKAASLAAQSLGLEPGFVNKTLTDKMGFYADRYSSLSPQADRGKVRDQIGAAERCLNEPLIEVW